MQPPCYDIALRPGQSRNESTLAIQVKRVVHLFGSLDRRADLAASLERLNHEIRQHAIEAGAAALANDAAPLAAIVIDDGSGPLALCAALSAECPVILVSADCGFGYRLATAEAGVKAVIRPPVNPIELAEWLRLLGESSGAAEAFSIVIVDDDKFMAELNAAILRAAGMTVEVACDPALALDAIEAALPDLVLMDMNMPSVDGIRLAQVIRQTREFLSMPIIFLSGERDEGRQLEARQLGGDDFLAKPIHPGRLISMVQLRADRARQLRSMIERDGLTGLYDHGRFNQRLSHELERCRRKGGELSLVMIDIDHFKAVNDRHGHPVGDAVLRTLASSLTVGLRRIDIVGRYGGEEFGIVLLDTDPRSARIVIDRIRSRFAELTLAGEEGPFRVTFSAGIASSRSHETLPAIVDAADRALYRAKVEGRNNVQVAKAGPAARLIEPSSAMTSKMASAR